MPLCAKCNRVVCNPCDRSAGETGKWRRIVVASDRELRRRSYFARLAMATKALQAELQISRREMPDWIADTIYAHRGEIVGADGQPFEVSDTDIDDAFNNDGSFRWLSGFIRFADDSPRQAPQLRVLDRLRLLDLAFRIARPEVARHFGR